MEGDREEIELSHSKWTSPIVVVIKENGSIILCIDFRKLNAVTLMDAYLLPMTDELREDEGQSRVCQVAGTQNARAIQECAWL